ncbi:S-adenosyl-L-methionine-dependent methyltransferase [Thozetella sp. PMI_491]|nr:S-adenosyl-L-methionine-dependent methyltransferase [Thozetella sp. PMI_491]
MSAAEEPARELEPADPGQTAEEDEFATDDLDGASLSNASTSLRSSVLEHSYENGRRYHRYRHGRYPIPNDDVEQNRDDMKHAMMLELTDGKLFFSPIGSNPQKIIDLGTGTGIWAVEVADQNPSAEVLGVDLSPIQPLWVPPNVKFIIDDVEDDWMHGKDWDLVHLRCLNPWLKDQAKVLASAFDNMRPGGWIEVQEFDGRVHSDDGTVTPDTALKRFFDLIPKAMANFGMNFNAGEAMKEPLEAAGFVNVNLRVIKVPFGPWAKDKTLRLVGIYCQTVMSDLVNAMTAKPFRTLKELNEVELQLLSTAAIKDMRDLSKHSYIKYLFWTAQKPE